MSIHWGIPNLWVPKFVRAHYPSFIHSGVRPVTGRLFKPLTNLLSSSLIEFEFGPAQAIKAGKLGPDQSNAFVSDSRFTAPKLAKIPNKLALEVVSRGHRCCLGQLVYKSFGNYSIQWQRRWPFYIIFCDELGPTESCGNAFTAGRKSRNAPGQPGGVGMGSGNGSLESESERLSTLTDTEQAEGRRQRAEAP